MSDGGHQVLMRGLLLLVLLGGVLCSAVPLVAAEVPPAVKKSIQAREDVLDMLFSQLTDASTQEEGSIIENAIQGVFLESGSASVDLLMSRGLDALSEDDHDKAFFYFDEAVRLMPAFAEGWNKRATVHFLRQNYAGALHDLEYVLRLEPRHYQAQAGLGILLEEFGDKKGALEAYRKALALNPWLEDGKERVKALEPDVEGRGI